MGGFQRCRKLLCIHAAVSSINPRAERALERSDIGGEAKASVYYVRGKYYPTWANMGGEMILSKGVRLT